VTESALRYVENDVPPDRERLAPAEVAAIRARCADELERGLARLVEASPPRPPSGRVRFGRGDPTLYIGRLGQAFGFLHVFERTGDAGHLELARRYLDAASEASARSAFPSPEEWLSFHATSGASAIAAVLYDRLGDAEASAHQLARYLRLAEPAADADYPTEDLLWGRGGFLFGAAFLRAQLGEKSVPDEPVCGALEAMIETGRRHAHLHAPHLESGRHGRTPLLYMNFNRAMLELFARAIVGGRSGPARVLAAIGARAVSGYENRKLGLGERYDLSLVHGLPGNLYLLLHFPELLRRGPAWADDVRAALHCLTGYVDADRGMLELLPSPRSRALQARAGTGAFTERVHWCGGTPGMVFVFARAYRVFGDPAFREAAERAAEHTWRCGLLRKGNGICHGVAGNGYAFLSLYRATSDTRWLDRALHFARHSWSERVLRQQVKPDRPWSLYEGAMGTLCFYLDCLDPARARFPGFEVP
jgi:hypothetical protein